MTMFAARSIRRFALLRLTSLAGVGVVGGVGSPARADEGMWLVNKPPLADLKTKYDFTPSPAWWERMQKSAINFGGASGSFVSEGGLVMTNHHVGSGALVDLSTAERDLLQVGFLAQTREQELKCPAMELRVLMTIEDVTDRVNAAVKPGAAPAEANAARRVVVSQIESQRSTDTGLNCRVITLYNGGRYHLYAYKTFTDVRLVFAPENAIASFGGDTDNFEYPRFGLDVCLFRVYENGKPYKPEHHLRFSQAPAREGELALVFGHPGRTNRLLTVDDIKFRRDVELPLALQNAWRTEVKLKGFIARGAENARIGRDEIDGVANGRKARTGQLAGLLDPAVMSAKIADEQRLRSAVEAKPEWKAKWGDAWEKLSAAAKARREWAVRATLVGAPRLGELFGHALTLVRLHAELKKPSGERLNEYRDSALARLRQGLESEAPILDALDEFRLREGLGLLCERLGADDPLVARLLGGKSPAARARELISGTGLKSLEQRRAMADKDAGGELVAKSADPMIALARELDGESRALRKRLEDEVEAVERENYAKIAAARFAVDGEKAYPDATGTLRVSFGPIKGYQESGAAVAPFTTFKGLFERYEQRKGQEGFDLPARWTAAREKLDLSTPFNFVCTADIIGGNSGSPVVNTSGDVIGLIFDGNLQSLPGAFHYDDTQNRAIAVDARAIVEALRKVYGAEALAKELTGQ